MVTKTEEIVPEDLSNVKLEELNVILVFYKEFIKIIRTTLKKLQLI